LIIAILVAAISALYATAGQAGGTGFVAILALFAYPSNEIRITALTLNVVAAGYATILLVMTRKIDWALLSSLLMASVPSAVLGGYIALGDQIAAAVTGFLLLAACAAIIVGRVATKDNRTVSLPLALTFGAITGLASGLSGIGGGIFLAPLLIMFGRLSPVRLVGLSPPFILINSIAGLAGVVLAGQRLSLTAWPLMLAALAGSIIGTGIGLRWRSEALIRYVLAVVLAVAGAELLIRAGYFKPP
jgi:uncharacterized membrane protein YfcA